MTSPEQPDEVILIAYDDPDRSQGTGAIPKAVRDRAGLQPGDEVDIDLDGDTIIVSAVRRDRKLAGRFAESEMAQRLLDDRAAEPR